MGFCSTFALAFQRCGAWFSIKKAIFERIPQTFMQKKQKEFQSEDVQTFSGLSFGKQYVFLVKEKYKNRQIPFYIQLVESEKEKMRYTMQSLILAQDERQLQA